MPPYPNFVGGSYVGRSRNATGMRAVNLYLEKNEDPSAKSPLSLLSIPGNRLFTTLPDGPVRTIFYQDGRCFAMAGRHFCELLRTGPLTGSYTDYSASSGVFLNTDGFPGSLCSNGQGGHQIFGVSGGGGYIFDLNTNTLSAITDADFPTGQAVMGVYADGWFVVLNIGSAEFQLSKSEDGTVWTPFQLAQRSTVSDNLEALIYDHQQLTLYGSKTTQVWVDTGNANFPFAPLQGGLMEVGLNARWAHAKFDNTLLGVALSERGTGWVWRADGYTPKRISHHGVEKWLQDAGAIEQLVAWTYEEEGHAFYALFHPNQTSTQVYDAENNQWHERDFYNKTTGLFEPARAMSHAYAWSGAGGVVPGLHLTGDRQNGNVYVQDLATLTDVGVNGAAVNIRKRRRCPHLTQEHKRVFYYKLDVDMRVGDGQGNAPQTPVTVIYRNSDDGGNTFNPDRQTSAGKQGEYDTRVTFEGNGSARDRVDEIEISDPAFVALDAAYLEFAVGAS